MRGNLPTCLTELHSWFTLTDGDTPNSTGIYIFLFFEKKKYRLRGYTGYTGFGYFSILYFLGWSILIRVKSFREMRGNLPTLLTFIIQIDQDDLNAVWVGDPVNLPILGRGTVREWSFFAAYPVWPFWVKLNIKENTIKRSAQNGQTG